MQMPILEEHVCIEFIKQFIAEYTKPKFATLWTYSMS